MLSSAILTKKVGPLMSQQQFLTPPTHSCRKISDKAPLTKPSRTEALYSSKMQRSPARAYRPTQAHVQKLQIRVCSSGLHHCSRQALAMAGSQLQLTFLKWTNTLNKQLYYDLAVNIYHKTSAKNCVKLCALDKSYFYQQESSSGTNGNEGDFAKCCCNM